MAQLKQAREAQFESLVGLGEEKVSAEQRIKLSSEAGMAMLRQMYQDLRTQLENETSFRTKSEEDTRSYME